MMDSKLEFKYERNETVIKMTTTEVVCSALITDFYYFLLACSFNKKTIVDSMDAVVQEYGDES